MGKGERLGLLLLCFIPTLAFAEDDAALIAQASEALNSALGGATKANASARVLAKNALIPDPDEPAPLSQSDLDAQNLLVEWLRQGVKTATKQSNRSTAKPLPLRPFVQDPPTTAEIKSAPAGR